MGKFRSVQMSKVSSPPTLAILREMFVKAQELPGSVIELEFGADESLAYRMTLLKDEDRPCLWTMYRLNGTSAKADFAKSSDEPEQVLEQINSRFPGWSLQSQLEHQFSAGESAENNKSSLSKPKAMANMFGSGKRSTLEGDLANMPVANLLQTLTMNKATGRLEIKNDFNDATVWFDGGLPVHCVLPESEGESALIEMSSWEKGEFYFFPEPRTDKQTIHRRIESLLMEGAVFQDQSLALCARNFEITSILVRKNLN